MDGEGLTPAAKEAIGELTKKLLSDAVSRAVREGADQLARKLRLSDDSEYRLLSGSYDWGSPDRDGDTWSVYLIKPGKPEQLPETVEVSKDGRPLVRFTRMWTPIERPIAILTRCRIDRDRLVQAELYLAYGVDGTWHATRPAVTLEPFDLGQGR